jgi:hypothetical protein
MAIATYDTVFLVDFQYDNRAGDKSAAVTPFSIRFCGKSPCEINDEVALARVGAIIIP